MAIAEPSVNSPDDIPAQVAADDLSQRFVAWVRAAAPFIHAFRGKTFVLGFGGEVAGGQLAQKLAYDCNLLAALGVRLVLVHGARPQIEAELARRGLTPRYHKGLRVTDADALECVKAAVAVTRIEVEALLSQGLPNTPMAGSFMRVTGGNFLTAKPVGVVDGIDYGFTGAVRKVIADEIVADLDQRGAHRGDHRRRCGIPSQDRRRPDRRPRPLSALRDPCGAPGRRTCPPDRP